MSEIKKVVLAYSGGLDTSIIIPWLKEHYDNCEVIAVCGNVGQKGELEGLEERAKASGASKLYIEDLTDEFVEDYVIPTMQAGADYEGYLLGTSFARPILAKRVVEIARAEGADAVCHGSTGKGNDQVRFELAIMHFAPDLKIITPWREWDIQSRDEEIDYAEAHHIPLKISRETNYSKDKNLWHLSHEGLDLEDPGNEPQYDKPGFLELGVSPKTAPDKSEFVELEFEKGVPVSLNGEKLKPAVLIAKLNEIGGRNGIGLYDVVENERFEKLVIDPEELEKSFRFETVAKEYALAKADLKIYIAKNSHADVAGTLAKDGLCYILWKGKNWSYVESGNVRGYVKIKTF